MCVPFLATTQGISNRKDDDKGKFYKRLGAHNMQGYNGKADSVKFEDWVAYMEKLLEVAKSPKI